MLDQCVTKSNWSVILDIQWVFLVQAHRPTLFAACRFAANHVAEHKEIMDGSEEFFLQIDQNPDRYAIPRTLVSGKALDSSQ